MNHYGLQWTELASRLASQSEPARLGSSFSRAWEVGSARLIGGSRAAPSRAEPKRARASSQASSYFSSPSCRSVGAGLRCPFNFDQGERVWPHFCRCDHIYIISDDQNELLGCALDLQDINTHLLKKKGSKQWFKSLFIRARDLVATFRDLFVNLKKLH